VSVFLDTSVLVAAVRTADLRHTASYDLVRKCRPDNSSCAAHTLAEVYSSLTGMRPPHRFRPEQAMLVVDGFSTKFRCVELNADDVLNTARGIAGLGLMGGIIYDALLLTCARKVNADRIYTWNVRHFQMVAPDLAARIAEPGQPNRLEVDHETNDDLIGFP
jgi:predicted nucleic acid-binding protein